MTSVLASTVIEPSSTRSDDEDPTTPTISGATASSPLLISSAPFLTESVPLHRSPSSSIDRSGDAGSKILVRDSTVNGIYGNSDASDISAMIHSGTTIGDPQQLHGASCRQNGIRSNSTSHLPVPSAVPFPSSSSTSDLPNASLAVPSSQAQRNSLSTSTSSRSSNIDALHIQKTYQRISAIGGIPRDGFVEGVELTRERRTEASISGYLSPLMASTSSSATSTSQRPDVARQQSAKAFSNLLQADDGAIISKRKASLASQKTQEEETSELQLLEKVDRYGFFAPTYSQHARLVLLARKDCLEIPSNSGLKAALEASTSNGEQTAKKKRSKRLSLASTSQLPNPYLSMNGQSGSQESSRRSSILPLASSTTSSSSLPAHSSPAAATGAGPENISRSSSYSIKENSRADKWYNEMLLPDSRDEGGNIVSWRLADGSDEKVGRRVVKGIPDRWRAAAWEALIARRRKLEKGKGKEEADDSRLRRRFFDLILEPCDQDIQIDLDVPRTISGHLYFHTRYGLGQRSLFNVLHAFALLCPECGYCQGMGSLAATFLCYLPPERAYTTMVRLHDTYDLHTIFAPGFPGMMECFYVQEQLVKVLMPEVHDMFEKNYITISSFATKWYITLFANVISFSTQLRIWDLFLLSGKDVLILSSTAIIWSLRRHLASPKADFESILSILSSFFVPEDEDALMRWVGKMLKKKELRVKMEVWKEEYRKIQV